MLEHEKTGREVERFIIEGECPFQITDYFFYIFTGMLFQQFLSDIAGDISFRFQGCEEFMQPAVAGTEIDDMQMFLIFRQEFNKNTFFKTIKVFVVGAVLAGYGVISRLRIMDQDMFLIVRQIKWLRN